jgi:hypothetical protein
MVRGRPGKQKGLTRADKPNHVDQDTGDVGGISSAKGVVSHPGGIASQSQAAHRKFTPYVYQYQLSVSVWYKSTTL